MESFVRHDFSEDLSVLKLSQPNFQLTQKFFYLGHDEEVNTLAYVVASQGICKGIESTNVIFIFGMKQLHYSIYIFGKGSNNLRLGSWVTRHLVLFEEKLIFWTFLFNFVAYRLIILCINSCIFQSFFQTILSSFEILTTEVKLSLKLKHQWPFCKQSIVWIQHLL